MKSQEQKSHFLVKVVEDQANSGFAAKVWNQVLIRPVNCRHEDVVEIIENGKELWLEGACAYQDQNETEDEFMLRTALEGIDVDFVEEIVRTKDWHEYITSIRDVKSGKVWKWNVPKA